MNKENSYEILNLNEVRRTYGGVMPTMSKTYFSYFLPIKSNSLCLQEFAYLVGKVMGDGHLDKNYSLKFIAGDEATLNKLKSYLMSIFNVPIENLRIRRKIGSKGKSFVLGVNFTPLGRMLYLIGAPLGNKPNTPFFVPSWLGASMMCKKLFLQAILEDELTTIKIKKRFHSVTPVFKLAKEKNLLANLDSFLKSVKCLLLDFGISTSFISKPTLTYTGRYEAYFQIHGNKENIIQYASIIGFRFNEPKLRNLEHCVEVLNKTRYNRKVHINLDELKKLHGLGYSLRKIAKELGVGVSSIQLRMKRLREQE